MPTPTPPSCPSQPKPRSSTNPKVSNRSRVWYWAAAAATVVAFVGLAVVEGSQSPDIESSRSTAAVAQSTSPTSVTSTSGVEDTVDVVPVPQSLDPLRIPSPSGGFVPEARRPVVDRFFVGEFDLTLRDGVLVDLRGPVEREVSETQTVETGRAYRVGAFCRDGTRSSATGRGACSWHGGVNQWILQRETKQVTRTSLVERVETICRNSACPHLGGVPPWSNIEAAARYVVVVNEVFHLKVPQREIDVAASDPEQVAATTLVGANTQYIRSLLQ